MTTTDWAAIQYRDFYDVPRVFAFKCHERCYLFDSKFEEDTDEYSHYYEVYELPNDAMNWLERLVDWRDLSKKGRRIARVAVKSVQFDESRRRFVNSDILAKLN